jgi:hypothetical protein
MKRKVALRKTKKKKIALQELEKRKQRIYTTQGKADCDTQKEIEAIDKEMNKISYDLIQMDVF